MDEDADCFDATCCCCHGLISFEVMLFFLFGCCFLFYRLVDYLFSLLNESSFITMSLIFHTFVSLFTYLFVSIYIYIVHLYL